ncbi:MAG: PSD1 domain-containing protein [Verrucomicrobiaceae bacterium]|nr:PSD1 domain-containing protein [Verrucomicrobiaceae bacterium]
MKATAGLGVSRGVITKRIAAGVLFGWFVLPLAAAPKEVDARGAAFFESKIRPLLVQHCYKCHSEAEGERKGGLLLDRQAGWLDGGDSGQTIIPGDVEGSIFIKAIRYSDEDMQMPPKYQLDQDVVELLEQWVRMGAPGPKQDIGETAFSKLGDQDILFERAKTHWAFQPVKSVEPPKTGHDDWDAHPVDRFVFAKMKEKGLTPSPQAKPTVLQRRLAYDLTGLPPDDKMQSSVAAEIERLMKSPHFGEHLARLWLDVARYADTANVTVPAVRMETYYPFAFTYRDYVIEAFNKDKPYDQFIKEQLAADLMGFKDRAPEQAALGFIAVTPFTAAPHDFVDDVIDTTTRGLLGLTVACARCHDHKFEPVPTADYYSLYGVFGSVDRIEHAAFGEFPVIEGYDVDATLRDDYQKKREVILAKVAAAKKSGKLVGARRPQWQIIQQSEMCELITFHDGAGGRAIMVKEKPKPITPRIFLRGEADTRGDSVPRRFLKLLDPEQKAFPEENSGRLVLANKIVDRSNPLTARVMVNRVWGFLIGSHLVDTPSDFGLQGAAPSHPELLDWLAKDFMDHGWSLKHLVRTIVSSRTYQQSSTMRNDMAAVDPTNQWLWRANSKRLRIEQLRDTLLALSGTLDPKLKGHPKLLWDVESNNRRSIYGLINRINTDPTLRAFDFPSTGATADKRTENIVPQQSLFALNSPFLIAKAKSLVESLHFSDGMSADEKANALFQRVYRRDASDKEQQRLIPFLALMEKRKQDPWAMIAHSLLSSNELLYLD